MTQEAQILKILQTRPITPIEALNECGCFRLASVIHKLRNKGYIIRTDDVVNESTGNTFARYTLMGEFKHGKADQDAATNQTTESDNQGYPLPFGDDVTGKANAV